VNGAPACQGRSKRLARQTRSASIESRVHAVLQADMIRPWPQNRAGVARLRQGRAIRPQLRAGRCSARNDATATAARSGSTSRPTRHAGHVAGDRSVDQRLAMVIEARRVTPGRTVRGKSSRAPRDDSSAETSNLRLPDPAAPDQRTLSWAFRSRRLNARCTGDRHCRISASRPARLDH
jgi:hypothetical protein